MTTARGTRKGGKHASFRCVEQFYKCKSGRSVHPKSNANQETNKAQPLCRPRVTQAEKELKEELEVKLAVSSLVSTVADNASMHRLEQGSSEVIRLEGKMRRAEAAEREGGLRAELQKTNVVVARLQAEINSARGWQAGVDDLRLKLMSQIEELKAMVEVRHNNDQQQL